MANTVISIGVDPDILDSRFKMVQLLAVVTVLVMIVVAIAWLQCSSAWMTAHHARVCTWQCKQSYMDYDSITQDLGHGRGDGLLQCFWSLLGVGYRVGDAEWKCAECWTMHVAVTAKFVTGQCQGPSSCVTSTGRWTWYVCWILFNLGTCLLTN